MNKIKIYASNRGYTANINKLEDIHPSWYDRDIWVGCALVDDTVDTDDEQALAEAFHAAENKEVHTFSADDVDFDLYPENANWGDGSKDKPGSTSAVCLWLEDMLKNNYSYTL